MVIKAIVWSWALYLGHYFLHVSMAWQTNYIICSPQMGNFCQMKKWISSTRLAMWIGPQSSRSNSVSFETKERSTQVDYCKVWITVIYHWAGVMEILVSVFQKILNRKMVCKLFWFKIFLENSIIDHNFQECSHRTVWYMYVLCPSQLC